jgi:capsular polysaccharide biosynthesis protein
MWWWVVLAIPMVAVFAGMYLTSKQPRIYRAAATVAVMPSPDISDPSDVMRGLETLERRTIIATFASMAETREALGWAAANLQLERSEVSGYRIQASVLPSTNIIRIDVRGSDGARVSVLANELVGVVAGQAKRMYRIFEMQPLEAARPARAPFHPDPARNAVVAGILGLFAGLLVTLLLEAARSSRIRHRGVSPTSLRHEAAAPDHAPPWSEASVSEEAVAASGGISRP